MRTFERLVALAAFALACGCDITQKPPLITVYNPALRVSFPLPQGWTSDEPVEQAGFHIQTYTGRSIDADRPGIRVQIMAGPTPSSPLDEVALRYRRDLDVSFEGEYSLADHLGQSGKTWQFISKDGEELSRLALVDVEGTLYGIFVRGETHTMESYRPALDRIWSDFSLEQSKYFAIYQAPGGDVVIKHPESWERTQLASNPGESLFVGFRSPPLAVEEDGTTVHSTLEVTVNKAPPELTVEKFYAERTETLGDTYRLLEHEVLEPEGAISTLYHVETQLAQYSERTVYAVRNGKSYIYKFNCGPQVYRAIEPWIDEMIRGFFEPVPES